MALNEGNDHERDREHENEGKRIVKPFLDPTIRFSGYIGHEINLSQQAKTPRGRCLLFGTTARTEAAAQSAVTERLFPCGRQTESPRTRRRYRISGQIPDRTVLTWGPRFGAHPEGFGHVVIVKVTTSTDASSGISG